MTTATPLAASEIAELEEFRLRRHWSYRELANAVGLPEPTLHRALTRPRARLRATTLYPIRQYIGDVLRPLRLQEVVAR